MGSCQSHYTFYSADGGSGRTVVAAVTAAEAASTAAAAAIAAANAAQEAAYAANAVRTANAVTSVSHTCGKQGHQPFPARRRKQRPNDNWRKMPHQEGWRSFTWDRNRAQSHKRHSEWYGAERGSPSNSRGWKKQRPQHHIQPQEQLRMRRSSYKGELHKEVVNMSTQTFSGEAKGWQAEQFYDESVTFSFSTCDSNDEAKFFPSTDPAHDPRK